MIYIYFHDNFQPKEPFYEQLDVKYLVFLGLKRNNCESEGFDIGRSQMSLSTSIFVGDCFFRRIYEFNGNGGVVCITNTVESLVINHTVFNNCSCNSKGGVIYIDCNDMRRVVFNYLCSFKSTAIWGHFIAFFGNSLPSLSFDMISVTESSHMTSGFASLYIESFQNNIQESNFSFNCALKCSTLSIVSSRDSFFAMNTFYSNKARNSICFEVQNAYCQIEHCTIVKNNSPLSDGVVYFKRPIDIKLCHSCFISNNNVLICVDIGQVSIIECNISHSYQLTSGVVEFRPESIAIALMTYHINHFSSYYCHNEITRNVENKYIVFFKSYILPGLSILLIISLTIGTIILFLRKSEPHDLYVLSQTLEPDFG